MARLLILKAKAILIRIPRSDRFIKAMSKNINDFLKDYKAPKGGAFTHTSLAGGSYNVPDSALTAFYKCYTIAFLSDGLIPLHLTEKHAKQGPVIIDLDFRQTSPKRIYDIDLIYDFILAYSEYLSEYVQCPLATTGLEFYVLQKGTDPRPYKDGIYKDGVHIIAPSIVTNPFIQEAVRNDFISNEAACFKDCGFSNPLDDIVDERVISKNNWFMYGSNKPEDGEIRYLVTHRVVVKISDDTLTAEPYEVDDPYDVNFIKLFSIRNKSKCTPYTTKGDRVATSQQRIKKAEEDFRMTSVSHTTINTTPLSSVTNLKTMDDEQMAWALVDILKDERADNYDSWIQLGMCLHNISDNLLDKWIEFSKRSLKYVEGECAKHWNKYFITKPKGGLTMGTLRMWAREDNPDEYLKIIQNNIMHLVFKSKDGSHNDVAKVVAQMYGNIYKCVKFNHPSVWYEFKNHKWCPVDNAYTLRMLMSNEICKLYLTASHAYHSKAHSCHVDENSNDKDAKLQIASYFKTAEAYSKIAFQLKTTSFKDSILKECAEMCYDEELLTMLDTNQSIIAFNNGVFDLSTMRFRDGIPDDYASMTTNYDFQSAIDDHVRAEILEFIKAISLNEECAEYLLKVLAYMLHGNKYLEYFWFFCGKGRNGKGTLCTLLEKTLGEYYYEPDITVVTCTKKNSSGANPELAKAKGKRVLCASEPDDTDKNSKFRVNKLKQLRGNDMIQARSLFKDFMEYRPQFGMIFQMNDKPDLSKADDAIARTLKILNFPWQFVDNPQEDYQRMANPTLKTKFQNDLKYRQQFMLILLEYYDKHVNGCKFFAEPEAVAQATRDYMEDNNPVAVWLKDHYEFTGKREDYISCERFMTDFNMDTKNNWSRRKFGDAMVALGHKSINIQNKRCYVGFKRIRLDDDLDDVE